MSEVFIPIIIVPTIMLVLGWMVRTISVNRRLRETAKMQTEMQTRLLEKFGTSKEMLEYLESDAGKKFVESATIERGNPHGRILAAVQTGVLLILGGMGFLVADNSFGVDGARVGFFLGLMSLLLGTGFLISSFISYRLSKSWGLFGNQPAGGSEVTRA